MTAQNNTNHCDVSRLIELAREKFSDLTEAEEFLIKCTEDGTAAIASNVNVSINNPENAMEWGEERTIRAIILEWLCSDSTAKALVSSRGIHIVGIKVEESINLQETEIPFSLSLKKCSLRRGIKLNNSKIKILDLEGTHTDTVEAFGMRIDGDVFMKDDFRARYIDLIGAEIRGSLDCSKGKINGEIIDQKKVAIIADRIRVQGSVLLRGFRAEGEICFAAAEIGGSFECDGGIFNNPGGYALNCARMHVRCDIMLRKGFRAEGEVRLLGTRIEADLDCHAGVFNNKYNKALTADGMKVKGNVLLQEGFIANGAVRLVGATVGGRLSCISGKFINENGDAINADGANINGSVFFRECALVKGKAVFIDSTIGGSFEWHHMESTEKAILDLRSANIDTIMDDKEGWPSKGNLHLDGFNYNKFAEEAPITAKDRIDWLNCQNDKHFRPQPYKQLAEVYQRSGYEENAKKVLIEKNRTHIRSGDLEWYDRFWLRFLGFTIGFGYRPRNTFAICVFIILLGAGIFELGRFCDCMVPPGNNSAVISEYFPSMNAIAYSLDTFIPLINLGQVENWIPNYTLSEKCFLWEKGYLLCWWFWIETILGWIFTTLLIVGLSGLIKK